jgi:predicted AAA+ superfamily ATPase
MYLPRSIDRELRDWSAAPDRKPLVLRGARQTGKTSAVRQLGSGFDLFLELNLERYQDLALVRACRSAEELLTALAVRENLAALPPRTLLFLDEIQESAEAVAWLRFFREDHPELAVIAAGSLMEVRLREKGFSFPVGRVTFRALRPMTYVEFLQASDGGVLAERLTAAARGDGELAPPLYDRALAALRDYLRIGGMPEAVATWLSGGGEARVRRVHADLVQALAEDLQKYRGVRDPSYLEAAFDSLRHHYGRRFKYENFAPGCRSQLMKTALDKLEAAMLVSRAWPTSSLELPLVTKPRSAPKLLPLDTALALFTMGFDASELSHAPIEQLLDGRIAEMFVGQELIASRQWEEPLHFWVSESARGSAEVDFLVGRRGQPLPVEVKAGRSGTLKSLHQFLWRSGISEGVRLYSGELTVKSHTVRMPDGDIAYTLRNMPLFMAGQL